MVSRNITLKVGKNQYILTLLDHEPFARPYTYLSSHCMLTAILFHEFYSTVDLKSRDNHFPTDELTYAVLHHDDGKNTEEWQTWFKQNNHKNWTNYRDHADDRLFDPSLHQSEAELLENFGITLKRNDTLAKWVMRNHHPKKQLDGLSLRIERILIVLADHLSAKIEGIQTEESLVFNLGDFLSGKIDENQKWLYGRLSEYFHSDLKLQLNQINVNVEINPKLEENIF